MKAFRNRFLPVAMVAGLAVMGVACEADDGNGDVDDPAMEDGTDDGLEDDGTDDLDDGLDDDMDDDGDL